MVVCSEIEPSVSYWYQLEFSRPSLSFLENNLSWCFPTLRATWICVYFSVWKCVHSSCSSVRIVCVLFLPPLGPMKQKLVWDTFQESRCLSVDSGRAEHCQGGKAARDCGRGEKRFPLKGSGVCFSTWNQWLESSSSFLRINGASSFSTIKSREA